MSSFLLTFKAKNDLEEIHNFIAEDNPSAALGFINVIQDKCQTIALSPEIGRQREELGLEIRSFPIKSSTIQVIRILHSARDIDSIFDQ